MIALYKHPSSESSEHAHDKQRLDPHVALKFAERIEQLRIDGYAGDAYAQAISLRSQLELEVENAPTIDKPLYLRALALVSVAEVASGIFVFDKAQIGKRLAGSLSFVLELKDLLQDEFVYEEQIGQLCQGMILYRAEAFADAARFYENLAGDITHPYASGILFHDWLVSASHRDKIDFEVAEREVFEKLERRDFPSNTRAQAVLARARAYQNLGFKGADRLLREARRLLCRWRT